MVFKMLILWENLFVVRLDVKVATCTCKNKMRMISGDRFESSI